MAVVGLVALVVRRLVGLARLGAGAGVVAAGVGAMVGGWGYGRGYGLRLSRRLCGVRTAAAGVAAVAAVGAVATAAAGAAVVAAMAGAAVTVNAGCGRIARMTDKASLEAYLDRVLADATIPELPNHYRGKVRDNYDLARWPSHHHRHRPAERL